MNFISKKLIGVSIIIFMILGFRVFAQNQDVVQLSIVEKTIKVYQGEPISVNLSITVNPTWHINSNKPNDDFLIPSEITAKGSGVKLSNVKYPQAKNLKLSFNPNFEFSVNCSSSNNASFISFSVRTFLFLLTLLTFLSKPKFDWRYVFVGILFGLIPLVPFV